MSGCESQSDLVSCVKPLSLARNLCHQVHRAGSPTLRPLLFIRHAWQMQLGLSSNTKRLIHKQTHTEREREREKERKREIQGVSKSTFMAEESVYQVGNV